MKFIGVIYGLSSPVQRLFESEEQTRPLNGHRQWPPWRHTALRSCATLLPSNYPDFNEDTQHEIITVTDCTRDHHPEWLRI